MDVLSHLDKAIKKAGSQSAFAKVAGISPQFLSDILARRREPSDKVLEALGLERTYKRKAKAS
jgi:hypothetical protein